MSTATNPRDVEEQIARILRYKAATAKDEESVRVLKTKSTELDKEIANIEFDEKGQEAYKVMRALLNRITDCENTFETKVLALRTQLAEAKEAVHKNEAVLKVLDLVRKGKEAHPEAHGWVGKDGSIEGWHTLE